MEKSSGITAKPCDAFVNLTKQKMTLPTLLCGKDRNYKDRQFTTAMPVSMAKTAVKKTWFYNHPYTNPPSVDLLQFQQSRQHT